MAGTYRDLLLTRMLQGEFAVFAARSGERAYIAYTVSVYVKDGSTECDCPAKKGTCWHVKEAPKALFYVQQREKFKAQSGEQFAAFFAEWWPRYQQATKEEAYLGKSRDDWEIWFAALLDERNERDRYTRKYIGQMRETLGELIEIAEVRG